MLLALFSSRAGLIPASSPPYPCSFGGIGSNSAGRSQHSVGIDVFASYGAVCQLVTLSKYFIASPGPVLLFLALPWGVAFFLLLSLVMLPP